MEPSFSPPPRVSHTLPERLLILPHITVLPPTDMSIYIHSSNNVPLLRAEGRHTGLPP